MIKNNDVTRNSRWHDDALVLEFEKIGMFFGKAVDC